MNITYHPKSPVAVCTWDWKEQPDMALITDILQRFAEQGHDVKLVNVETESDEYCCVICPKGTTEEEARMHWLREGIDLPLEVILGCDALMEEIKSEVELSRLTYKRNSLFGDEDEDEDDEDEDDDEVYAFREGDWCVITGHEYGTFGIPMDTVPALIEHLMALLPETKTMLT
jgi:hypothetical protein